MNKIQNTMSFLLIARQSLVEAIRVSKIKVNSSEAISYIMNEASDYEIMNLLVNQKIPKYKYDNIKENELWKKYKKQVNVYEKVLSNKTINSIMEMGPIVQYGISTCGPILETLEITGQLNRIIREDARDDYNRIMNDPNATPAQQQAAQSALQASTQAGATPAAIQQANVQSAQRTLNAPSTQASPELQKSAEVNYNNANQAGMNNLQVGMANTKAAVQNAAGHPLQTMQNAGHVIKTSAQQLGHDVSTGAQHIAGDAKNFYKGVIQNPNQSMQNVVGGAQQMGHDAVSGIKGFASNVMNNPGGAMHSALGIAKMAATKGVAALAPYAPALAGAGAAAAVGYGAYKLYQKLFAKNANQCQNLQGPEKQACMAKAKQGALQAEGNEIQKGSALCNKAQDPEKCRQQIMQKAAKVKRQMSQG